MSETQKGKVPTPEFKAKVVLEALRRLRTINATGQGCGVHPVQVGQWSKELQEQTETLFERKLGPNAVVAHREPEPLYSEIGKLKVELDWLKKLPGSACPDAARVDRQRGLRWPRSSNAFWRGVTRATVYARQEPSRVHEGDLLLSRVIDEEHTTVPVVWAPQDGCFPQGGGPYRQSQAATTPDGSSPACYAIVSRYRSDCI